MPADPIKLIVVNNPFDVGDRQIHNIPFRRQRLRTLQRKYVPDNVDLNIRVNQHRVKKEEQKTWRLHPGDEVIMVPDVQIGAIAAWAATGIWGVAAGLGYTLTYAAVYIGLAVGMGYLIRALGPKPEDADFGTGPQAFSWNPVTRQRQGMSIARDYGRNKKYGNILASWTMPSGRTEDLVLLLGLSEGPVKGIVAGSFCIQDQPAGNFGGITTYERKGTLDQASIFSNLKLEYRPHRNIDSEEGPEIWTTPDNDFDRLEIGMKYWGHYYHHNGKWHHQFVNIKIEIREHPSGGWKTLVDTDRTIPSPVPRQKNYKSHIDYTGGSPVTITNGKRYDIRVDSDYCGHEYADGRKSKYLELASVREVIDVPLKHPGLSMLGISALATEKISGNLKVSCIQEGRVVNVYNGTSWSIQYSTNPAWVIWDIMTQPVISGDGSGPDPYVIERYDGVDPNRLVPSLQKFYLFALWCDQMVPDGEGGTEKRIEFNGSFDEGSNMWAAVKKVCSMSRCEVVPDGINYTIIVDKAWTAEPVQLFSAGNMQPDTFRRDYLPLEDRAAEIEIIYLDASQDYEMVPLTFYDSGIDNPNKKISIKAVGVNKISQAWRMAYYELAKNRLIKSVSSFETDVDAIACQKGDVINVAPPWRRDGRVVSCPSNNQVILDAPKMGSGDDTIVIRSRNPATGDDNVKTYTVASVDGTLVAITGSWTIWPKVDDVYAFGPTARIIQKHRVVGIGAGEELRHKIVVAEYHAGVYSGDGEDPVIPIGSYVTPQSVPDRTRPPTLNDFTYMYPDELLKESNYDVPLTTDIVFG